MLHTSLLAWLAHDPMTMVTMVYWAALSLTAIIAITLGIVAVGAFRRALVQASTGPHRPGGALGVQGGPGLFQASAREAFRASFAAASEMSAGPVVRQIR